MAKQRWGRWRGWLALVMLWSGVIIVPAVDAAESLIVYSGRGEKFTRPTAEAFTKQTGIPVQMQTGKSAAILAKLRVERDKSPADIFITNYVGVLEEARKHDLLAPVTSPMVEQIPAEFRAQDHTWLAFSARLRVIVYNTDMVKPDAISSLLDLAEAKWHGKVGTVTSGNQSFIGGLTALYALHGAEKTEAFLQGLKANSEGRVMPKHTPVVSAVAAGQFPLGYVNHYYYYRHKAKNPDAPLGILIPDQGDAGMGAVVTVAGAAMLKSSKNREVAQKFMTFLISPAGQEIFAKVNYEYPVNPKVTAHEAVVPRDRIKLAPVNLAQAFGSRAQAIALIEKVGLE